MIADIRRGYEGHMMRLGKLDDCFADLADIRCNREFPAVLSNPSTLMAATGSSLSLPTFRQGLSKAAIRTTNMENIGNVQKERP